MRSPYGYEEISSYTFGTPRPSNFTGSPNGLQCWARSSDARFEREASRGKAL
jgi:hypothetical protein